MGQVVWTEPALSDLQEIYEYIARDSPRYGGLMVDRITQAADRLAEFPQLGELLPEFRRSKYRQFVVGAYRLIYREDPLHDRLLVMAVVHGARDFPRVLEDR